MKTSQEIRIANLKLLLAEAGSAAELSRQAKIAAPYISQLIGGATNKSGKPRTMADDAARKFERGMEKAVGWIDTDHSAAMPGNLAEEVAELTRIFSTLPAGVRTTVLASIRGISHGQHEVSKPSPSLGMSEGVAKLGKHSAPMFVPIRKKTNAAKKRKPDAL